MILPDRRTDNGFKGVRWKNGKLEIGAFLSLESIGYFYMFFLQIIQLGIQKLKFRGKTSLDFQKNMSYKLGKFFVNDYFKKPIQNDFLSK